MSRGAVARSSNAHGQLASALDGAMDAVGDEPGEMEVLQPAWLGGGSSSTPRALKPPLSAVAAGLGNHTCALLNSGRVKCWG